MQLFQKWLHCLRMETKQVWSREGTFVQLLLLGQPETMSFPLYFIYLSLLIEQSTFFKKQDQRIHPARSDHDLENLDLLFLLLVGLCRSSTSITRDRSCPKEIAKVAKESARVVLLLGICCMVKNSKLDCKRRA